MPKTKESIAAYNKEYFARPEVIARAKVRNSQRRGKRAEYKKTERGIEVNKKYKNTDNSKRLQNISRLKSRYGITMDDVNLMKHKQNDKCAICLRSPKTWHIDHDHSTKKVRGMLCGPCNMAMGLLKDSQESLLRAVEYLNGVI
jgi:hypothetical protein